MSVPGPGERATGRIFGVGLIKTGTTSLRAALEILGYRALHGGQLETVGLVQRAIDAGEPMLTYLDPSCEAFADVFGVTHYFYLADVQYPGSKFILTVRDLDEWIDSRRRHTLKNQEMQAAGLYEGDLLQVDVDAWVTEYRRHEAVVRGYFGRRPGDLLVLDVFHGEAWEPLCEFLGRPIPEEDFPWVNKFRPLREKESASK